MAKKSVPPTAPSPESELTVAINRLTDMLGIVDDTLRGIKDDITWIINNRDDIALLQGKPTLSPDASLSPTNEPVIKADTIRCVDCDIEAPIPLAEARQKGWSELVSNTGSGWRCLGLCPVCLRDEDSIAPSSASPVESQPDAEEGSEGEAPRKTLFE